MKRKKGRVLSRSANEVNHLEVFVDSLDAGGGPWPRLRENPEVMEDEEFNLSDTEIKLLQRGPREELLDASGRPPKHLSVTVLWFAEE